MGFFSNLFKKKDIKSQQVIRDITIDNPECLKLLELKDYMSSLLSANRYIPKSEYRTKLLDEKKNVEYFAVLDKSGMLKSFCDNNHIPVSDVESTLTCYRNYESLVDSHNDNYIEHAMRENKVYLDNILRDVDPQIKLDDDQRKVEKRNLAAI